VNKEIYEYLSPYLSDDSSILLKEGYLDDNINDILDYLQVLLTDTSIPDNVKAYKLRNLWQLFYRIRPPTVEEFLTPKWIGVIADKIYPQVKEAFKQYMQPLNGKRVLALSTCIGWGKTTLSTLIATYIVVHLHYMKNPKRFFNLNEIGAIVIALMSFTQRKVNQLLLQPFYTLLKSSPMFERVWREDRLEIKQKEIGDKKIAYTSAGRMGAFQFSRDIHITIASSREDLLGMNIILGIVSEISFWINRGIAIEEIWGAFSDMRERVNSRFAHRYLSGVILDSSPLDLSTSPIDKWIYEGDAQTDPEVLIINAKHWDMFPEKYPKWQKTNQTIPVFKGDAARPPKVLNDEEYERYAKEEIIEFPIDMVEALKNSTGLKRVVADFAGWPAGSLPKLIDDKRVVENIFTNKLNNVYTSIVAPDDKDPEKLIWYKVRDLFFIKSGRCYEFYRAPHALRTIHIDLAESGDMACISMCHLEIDIDSGSNIVVGDFTIPISPEKSKINLDAVCNFILDLKKEGHISFYKVTADQYQSSALLQRLKRNNIEVDKLSVDRDTTPYRVVISWIYNNRIRIGRNVILKNNLLSLVEVKNERGRTKIDHTNGRMVYEDNGDWNRSLMGINAKDASDSFVGSAYTLIAELENSIPQYTWRDEQSLQSDQNDEDVVDMPILEELRKKFNYIYSDN